MDVRGNKKRDCTYIRRRSGAPQAISARIVMQINLPVVANDKITFFLRNYVCLSALGATTKAATLMKSVVCAHGTEM